MDDLYRKIALMGYEQDGNTSPYFKDPSLFYEQVKGNNKLQSMYGGWKSTKRNFTHDEITTGKWLKIGTHGYTFLLTCSPDGTFSEYNIFNESHTNQGKWELHDLALKMTIQQFEDGTPILYILDVMGNKTGVVHSGLETRNDVFHAYFKVFHVI